MELQQNGLRECSSSPVKKSGPCGSKHRLSLEVFKFILVFCQHCLLNNNIGPSVNIWRLSCMPLPHLNNLVIYSLWLEPQAKSVWLWQYLHKIPHRSLPLKIRLSYTFLHLFILCMDFKHVHNFIIILLRGRFLFCHPIVDLPIIAWLIDQFVILI